MTVAGWENQGGTLVSSSGASGDASVGGEADMPAAGDAGVGGGGGEAGAPVGNGPVLTVQTLVPPSEVNLTVQGSLDWMHWGLPEDSSVNRKKNGFGLGVVTFMGDGPFNFVKSTVRSSWSDGVPEGAVNSTDLGAFLQGVGSSVVFTVPVATSPRLLSIYAGAFSVNLQLTASMDDPAAPSYDQQILSPAAGQRIDQRIDVLFSAPQPGHVLSLALKINDIVGDYGNSRLIAATLAPR